MLPTTATPLCAEAMWPKPIVAVFGASPGDTRPIGEQLARQYLQNFLVDLTVHGDSKSVQ